MGRRSQPVRREIRTLSPQDVETFVNAVKILRNTSDSEGTQRFGGQYRSYDYLIIKHAVSAAHGCLDQGHTAWNQIIFHRALLAEFEGSLLSVARAISPDTSLTGLPYWNYFIDLEDGRDVRNSSLWSMWGSPFGDPERDYCIFDPVFQTRVGSFATLNNGLVEMFRNHLGGDLFLNGYGMFRSPWSASRCPSLVRNPGWVFGAPSHSGFLDQGVRNCSLAKDFPSFATCIQGTGFAAHHADIGPHNLLHIYFGTLHDENYSFSLSFVVAVFFCSVPLAIAGILVGLCGKQRFWTRLSITLHALVLFALFLVLALVEAGVESSLRGMQAAVSRQILSSAVFNLAPPEPNGRQWRTGQIQCPPPGTCDTFSTLPQDCLCSSPQSPPSVFNFLDMALPRSEYVGSDFWDGAFSVNENFFFPLHAFVDLLHFEWAASHIARVPEMWQDRSFGGVSNVSSDCPGTALPDTISEEMCFTSADIGSEVNGTSPLRSSVDSSSPGLSCLTLRDVFTWSLPYQDSPPALNVNRLPYVYDVMVERYSWRAKEPVDASCPPASQLCERVKHQDFPQGRMLCVQNGNWLEPSIVVEEENCRFPKPPTPQRECSCEFERIREKEAVRRTKQLSLWSRPAVALLGVLALLAFGSAFAVGWSVSCIYLWLFRGSRQVDYELVPSI